MQQLECESNSITCMSCSYVHQGLTLAMCPLARMHFLGRRATTIHFMLARGASGFQIGKRMYQFFSVDVSRALTVIACRRAMV